MGVAASLVVAAMTTGCANDLYSPCDLTGSENPTQQACATEGDTVTCAIDPFFQCDVGTCARFEGSTSYCTTSCSDDLDCGDGRCLSFNIIDPDAVKYCVPNDRTLITSVDEQ